MSVIHFTGDDRAYRKYRHTDGRMYVSCLATKVIQGMKVSCSYRKRFDHHKKNCEEGKFHICSWTEDNGRNGITNYFIPPNKDNIQFTEDELKRRLAILLAQKNISIDTGASIEFYKFIVYCIAYGINITAKQESIIKQAENSYRHFKETAIRNSIIEAAHSIKKEVIENFRRFDYCSLAIDEGATYGQKNVVFNLENPLAHIDPFPVCILPITNTKAGGYVEVISQAFDEISNYNIKIGSCICDGNLAQKKAFSYTWKKSLRFFKSARWLKEVIFIPCLCHKLNNAYKMTILHNPVIQGIIEEIRNIGELSRKNKDQLGITCPSFVTTRWIYDFEIIQFILHNQEKISLFSEIPENIDQLQDVLAIFRTLVTIFEDPKTPFYKGFIILERSQTNFKELIDNGNQFAQYFYDSFLEYTLHSPDSGLWVLGYLLTESGHDDFYERIKNHQNEKVQNPIRINRESIITEENRKADELENTIDEIANHLLEDDKNLDDMNSEEELTDSEYSEELADKFEYEEDYILKIDQPLTQKQKFKKLTAILLNEKYVEEEEEEENDNEQLAENEIEESQKKLEFFSYINSAQEWLKEYLTNICYSKRSVETILRTFNSYLDYPKPFRNCLNSTEIGFSWTQIGMYDKAFDPIAEIARKLHAAGLSEASCERTISNQRLIYASRRRNSKRDLLDARLTIMNGKVESSI